MLKGTVPACLSPVHATKHVERIISIQVAWQKCEPETNHNSAVILEIFKGVASLASATVDGKVLSFPVMAFHDEYAQHLEHCKEERKDAVFLLSDEQVIKQLVPLALDLVTETQQKDYAEVASLSIIASLPRIAGALKKTQVQKSIVRMIERLYFDH